MRDPGNNALGVPAFPHPPIPRKHTAQGLARLVLSRGCLCYSWMGSHTTSSVPMPRVPVLLRLHLQEVCPGGLVSAQTRLRRRRRGLESGDLGEGRVPGASLGLRLFLGSICFALSVGSFRECFERKRISVLGFPSPALCWAETGPGALRSRTAPGERQFTQSERSRGVDVRREWFSIGSNLEQIWTNALELKLILFLVEYWMMFANVVLSMLLGWVFCCSIPFSRVLNTLWISVCSFGTVWFWLNYAHNSGEMSLTYPCSVGFQNLKAFIEGPSVN